MEIGGMLTNALQNTFHEKLSQQSLKIDLV